MTEGEKLVQVLSTFREQEALIQARCDLQTETFLEGGEAQDNLLARMRRLIVGRYLNSIFPSRIESKWSASWMAAAA